MDWRKRMERTLFCLLVSMTLGAIVLHMGQPSHTPGGPSVRLTGETAKPDGYTVIIEPQRNPTTGQRGGSHFYVDRKGTASPTDEWLSHERNTRSGDTLRIGLQLSVGSDAVTPAQWTATERLLQDLQTRLQTSNIRVVVDRGVRQPSRQLSIVPIAHKG